MSGNATNLNMKDEFDLFREGDDDRRKEFVRKTISLIIVILLLLFYIFSFFIKTENTNNISGSLPDYDPSLSQGIIPGMNKDEIEKILQQAVDESMFSFQINSRIEFENTNSKSNLLLGNPPNNAYDFYVEIVLDETNEVLYKSGRIPPNHYIEKFNLNRQLPKGEYKATAYFNIYDKSGSSIFAKSAAGLNLIIKN